MYKWWKLFYIIRQMSFREYATICVRFHWLWRNVFILKIFHTNFDFDILLRNRNLEDTRTLLKKSPLSMNKLNMCRILKAKQSKQACKTNIVLAILKKHFWACRWQWIIITRMWWEMSKPSNKTTDTFDMRRSLESDSDTMVLMYEHWCSLRFLRMNIYVHYIKLIYMSIKLDAINVFICNWFFSSKISLMSISVDNYQIDTFYNSENCLFHITLSITASNDQAGFFSWRYNASAG